MLIEQLKASVALAQKQDRAGTRIKIFCTVLSALSSCTTLGHVSVENPQEV